MYKSTSGLPFEFIYGIPNKYPLSVFVSTELETTTASSQSVSTEPPPTTVSSELVTTEPPPTTVSSELVTTEIHNTAASKSSWRTPRYQECIRTGLLPYPHSYALLEISMLVCGIYNCMTMDVSFFPLVTTPPTQTISTSVSASTADSPIQETPHAGKSSSEGKLLSRNTMMPRKELLMTYMNISYRSGEANRNTSCGSCGSGASGVAGDHCWRCSVLQKTIAQERDGRLLYEQMLSW